ncbi:MAG TPA: hypothetical protein VJ987_04850 [Anaerolineales bacterium]|nr:hypothetical protein [Anaerolineales bacterium]
MKKKNDVDRKAREIDIAGPAFEEPVFSQEFLSAIKDTAFEALAAYLEKIGAKKDALDLLQDIAILTTWDSETEKDGKVKAIANQFMLEAVSSASHKIAAIGGVFHSPGGTSYPREITG